MDSEPTPREQFPAQKKHRVSSAVIVMQQRMIKSPAWLSLGSAAKDIYLLLRCQCIVDKEATAAQKKRQKQSGAVFKNGRELILTYSQAQDYGISAGRFRRGVDELVERGFIDIVRTGFGLHKVPTLYGLSERWRHWGTDSFDPSDRPKAAQGNMGFQPGNRLGRNCRKQKHLLQA